jgi:FixJ family two-component response regulator
MSAAFNSCPQASGAFLKGVQHAFERLCREPEVAARGIPATSSTPPAVCLVDDDRAVRDSLATLVESTGWRVHAFGTAREFLEHPRAVVPSCLVLDVDMPGIDALELQKRLAVERPELPVVFLTRVSDIQITVEAMKAGASDFLLKPCASAVLARAVGTALERSRATLDRRAHDAALRDRYACLSPREREVLALVVAGNLNKQVGAQLGISEITVKAHRGSVMRKMKARSLPDLVTMAADLDAGKACALA